MTPAAHQTCLTCRHYRPHADVRMAGYGACSHLPPWRFYVGKTTLCQAQPVLWAAAMREAA